MTESERYITAVRSFQDRYRALPGDMRNAVKFWGAQAGDTTDGTDTTCAALTVAATGTATCNGNGNGQIALANSTYDAQHAEQFRFWQHLANANLIEGTYSGIVGTGGVYHSVIGTNVPASKIASVGWSTRYMGTADESSVHFSLNPGNRLLIGGQSTNTMTHVAAFSPQEIWNIDVKIDDGKPGRGRFVAVRYAICTTATTAAMLDAEYLLGSSGLLCAAAFVHPY